MQVINVMLHELHVVLGASTIHTLRGLRQATKNQSLTKFITGVLELLFPWLEHEHLFGKERQARYGLVNDDPGMQRLHVHLMLPYSLYKRMKLVYQDLNFFSIAQLVRWLLEEFISLTNLYGERVREVVEGRLRRSCAAAGIDLNVDDNPGLKSGNKGADSFRKKIRQLSNILNINLSEFSLLTLYDSLSFPKIILKC